MIKNRKEAEAIIANFEIVKAFAAGETIQVRPYGNCPWRDADELDLTMIAVDWRVKSSVKWRPYTLVELADKVGSKVFNTEHQKHSIESVGHSVDGSFVILRERFGSMREFRVDPEQLLKDYEFMDGRRCGVEVTD